MPGKKRFFLEGKGTFSGKKKSRCVKNKTKIGFFKERSFNFIPEKSTFFHPKLVPNNLYLFFFFFFFNLHE